jgi:hypothetical protein
VGTTEELNAFIRALAKPQKKCGTPISDFEWKCGIKEFRSTFRKTKESTSCGPSGINMSYWKAVSEDGDIARVHSFLIEKAFRHGFSYPKWQESWHCMLQRRISCTYIDLELSNSPVTHGGIHQRDQMCT